MAIVVLISLGLPGTAQGATSKPSGSNSFFVSSAGFAGYRFIGSLHGLAATFEVPEVTGSMQGDASTWIGAQSPSGDFIQIGATESFEPLPATFRTLTVQDEAFWSDTKLHFSPHLIKTVKPGDELDVSMVLDRPGWVLQVADVTQGWTRSFQSHYGAVDKFNDAEFHQEDPVAGDDPFENLAYPSLSETVFSGVRVNGGVPDLTLANSVDMNVYRGPELVPQRLAADSFGLVAPVGFQHDYLAAVAADDHFGEILDRDLAQRAASGPLRLGIDIRRLLAAVSSEETGLKLIAWPRAVGRAAARMVQLGGIEESQVRVLESSGESPRSIATLRQTGLAKSVAANRIRSGLGLGP